MKRLTVLGPRENLGIVSDGSPRVQKTLNRIFWGGIKAGKAKKTKARNAYREAVGLPPVKG